MKHIMFWIFDRVFGSRLDDLLRPDPTRPGVSTTISDIITMGISAIVSGVVSMFVLGYIRRYIDQRLADAAEEKNSARNTNTVEGL